MHLDDHGVTQADRTAERLATVPLRAVVSSPLERTVSTAGAIVQAQALQGRDLVLQRDEAFIECDYGSWTGRSLKELAKEPAWKQVQSHPSSVTFPSGESMMEMQLRAVRGIRQWNDIMGPEAIYAVVSHGDVIKAILADALGMHLDHFQRIVVDPCSVSVIEYAPLRPFVSRTNDNGEDLSSLAARFSHPKKKRRVKSSDAPVGGGAGV
jgi:probable phosphomutase (TIGR03848 family)